MIFCALIMIIFCTPVSWYAIYAFAGTPRGTVVRINAEAKRAQRPE
jgi:hypothetical protein